MCSRSYNVNLFIIIIVKTKGTCTSTSKHLTSTSKFGQGNKSKDVPRNQDVHDQVE